MFIHSIWRRIEATTDEVIGLISGILASDLQLTGGSPSRTPGQIEWLRLTVDRTQPTFSASGENDWEGSTSPGAIQRNIFQISNISGPFNLLGFVGPDPTYNYALLDRISEPFELRELSFEQESPFAVAAPGWNLYALHLRSERTRTEVVVQGELHRSEVLESHGNLFHDLSLFGVTLARPWERELVTIYDDGQVWMQSVPPGELPLVVQTLTRIFGL